MSEYRDTDFKGKRVLLDGSTFTGCTFRDCMIVFGATKPCVLAACKFKENIQWEFEGDAAGTLKFLTALYNGSGEGGRQLIEQTFESIRRGLYK